MNPFDDLIDMADETFDAINAEPFTLKPMRRSANGRASADPDRDEISGEGIFELKTEPAGLQTGNREHSRGSNDFRTLATSSTPMLSVRQSSLGGSEIRQGDEVHLRGQRYSVVSSQPDGHGRITLTMVAA